MVFVCLPGKFPAISLWRISRLGRERPQCPEDGIRPTRPTSGSLQERGSAGSAQGLSESRGSWVPMGERLGCWQS